MTYSTNDIADARGGKPSASRMTRIFNCPASLRLNEMETPESSAAADEGTRLHKCCELILTRPQNQSATQRAEGIEEYFNLSDELRGFVDFAVTETVKRRDACELDFDLKTEMRLWAKSGLFSGQGDVVILEQQLGRATIIDFKFGRGEVERAERNYQLAAMAVLVADNFDFVKSVRAMIIQPRALDKGKRITECVYTKDDVDAAREAINAACKEAIEAENPAQKCGYWCKYCPSSYRCKAAQEAISAQYKLAVATPNLTIGAHNARQMFERAQLVKKYCEDVLAAVKNYIINNPDAQCGLTLAPGVKRAKLGDAAKVYEAVEGLGITPEEFVNVCDVSISKLQSLYYDKRKLANEKQTKKASDIEAKKLLEERGLLKYTQTAPTLKLLED